MVHTSISKDHPRAGKAAILLGVKPSFPVIVKYSFDLQSLDVSKGAKTRGSHEVGDFWVS